ncbi:phosphohydrolase, partial [Rhizobium leguminosarum]
DHFQTKLFKLAEGFHTETGRRLSAARDKSLRDFLSEFMDEI